VSRPVSIVAAQVAPVAFDACATLEKFEEEVRVASAAWPETALMIFPELYLTGEVAFGRDEPAGHAQAVAEAVPGPLTERIGKIAERSGMALAAGSVFEREGDDIYNTALVFSEDGSLVARHRKVFPWAPWEQVRRGQTSTVFDLPGVGRIGVMICYEGWFPEVARALALKGAEVIIQPSLTSTADREQELVLARANAITNQCFVLNVNSVLPVGGGKSIGADPEGHILFQCADGEELVTEVLDLARTTLVRQRGTRGLNRLMRDLKLAPQEFWDEHRNLLPGDG